MRRLFLIVIVIASVLASARPIEASPLERAFLPAIMSSSCSDLCGYCVITILDHSMGC